MIDFAIIFIALCWAIFLLFILISAFSVKRTVEVDRPWLMSNWLVTVLFIAAFLFFKYAPHEANLVPRTLATEVIADILALTGLITSLWGRVALGGNWSMYPVLKEDHELIERGPYAYVRHPIYSGLILMLLGSVVWLGNVYGLIFFAACLVGTWVKLRHEERLLTRHFGASYTRYKERVKALIPYVL
jgi:protein-S-isoprenylcysteine O-methyltransferase Ste14